MNKTFNANGILEGFITKANTETFVYLGSVDEEGTTVAEDFDSGTILIGKRDVGGTNIIPLKRITSLDDKDDKASRFILPENQELVVILSGSTSPTLYAEIQSGERGGN